MGTLDLRLKSERDFRKRHVPEVNSADGSHLLSPVSWRLHEKMFESGILKLVSRSPRKWTAIGARYSAKPLRQYSA